MQERSYLSSLITPSASQSFFQRYVVGPVDHIGHALLWSVTTTSVALGSIPLVLTIVMRDLPNCAYLWTANFPSSIESFASPHLGFTILSLGLLGWLNLYCVKQTRQAYKNLRIWAVSIRLSVPGRNGEHRHFTLRHLMIAWGNARELVPSLRFLFIAILQSLFLLQQQTNQDQQTSSSGTLGTLMVVNEYETTAAMMTVLTEDRPCVSETVVPAEKQTTVVPGIFGTIFNACQIRLVGPTGKEQVVDLHHRPYLPLWLYLAAVSITKAWISIGDILRDVYGYDESAGGDGEQETQDAKRKLLNQFHNHHRILCKDINHALGEVGLPRSDLLHNKRRNGISYWRLVDTIQLQDLTVLETCRTLLAQVQERQADDAEFHEQVISACEQLNGVCADLAIIKQYTEIPRIQKLLREILTTRSCALKYLAQETHAQMQQMADTQTKQQLLRKEQKYWATHTLMCARFASALPGHYEQLHKHGEQTLRKALFCSLQLQDREQACALYQEYQEIKEQDGDCWKPDKRTASLWKQILALESA